MITLSGRYVRLQCMQPTHSISSLAAIRFELINITDDAHQG